MSGLAERIAALTPAQRRLLEQRMQREGLAAGMRPGGVPHQPDAEHYALSFGQQRLWFLHQLAPASPAYNIPFAGRLEGPLDPALLERSVNEVVRRHEILRTVFTVAGEVPVQKVLSGLEVRIAVDDLTLLPPDEREAEAERRVNDEARVPFDLATPPLLRVRVLLLAPEVQMLLVTMPHIVTDAWSMAVFFREVPVLYDAFAEGLPSPLPEPAIQFRDYAIHQRQTVAGEALERLTAHWKQALAGAPPALDLPADFPRPLVHRFRGRRHAVDLPREIIRQFERLGQGEGATPFMALLAAFAVLLHRYSG
ncbi:MAG: condensation domain-containing protein, partial [Candidatus Eisenbacteria bacterium]